MIKERLKELRLEKKLTQAVFAGAIDTNQRQVSKWEIGRLEPNIAMLIKIADYFEVSIDYLVGRKDY